MRNVTMCFTLLQLPRFRIHTSGNSWRETFPILNRRRRFTSSFRVLGSGNYGFEGGQYRRYSKQTITTKTDGIEMEVLSSKTNIKDKILDETISTNLNTYKSRLTEVERTQVFDMRHKISENKELAKPVTFIVFDIETTGFSRRDDRIIEIALQDLAGGKNSTFQTLVNPGCYVRNSHIHGISNHMVNKPNVPRMQELIPILLEYIKSRQKPGGFAVLIAHNARTFDVPFLTEEFSRCCYEIPPDWLFIDTLPLAREAMKSKGLNGALKLSLQALGEAYKIRLPGSAHRALTDVQKLSLIFRNITYDLKLPCSGLIEKYSFSDLELRNLKKKKSSGKT
ncbi:hypothetical protein ACH5RR_026555 [Cinchona calisaya]|uniref:Exonuclease domain-containing protein n=1 Tax=Cinchona calisaya TaxID=153742 RepID=A0ABD2Z2X1_9GENT